MECAEQENQQAGIINMDRLFNKYSMHTEKGAKIFLDFAKLSEEFLKKYAEDSDIIDLEHTMKDATGLVAAQYRLSRSLDLKKAEKEKKKEKSE